MVLNRPILIAAAGGLAVAAAILINFVLWRNEVTDALSSPAQPPKDSAATVAADKPSTPAALLAPTFDVVRVDPRGNTVAAGRASPGSTVTIFDHGREIGRVTADQRGEWVFVPGGLLPPGSRELSLEMKTKEGASVASETKVIVVVPERDKDVAGQPAEGRPGALALKIDKSGASTVMQKPAGGDALTTLSVDAIDYNGAGELSVSGRAAPDAEVLVYLDNAFVGRARAGSDGLWRVTPTVNVKPGKYELRADQVDRWGKVAGRVALPFVRDEPVAELKPGTFVVVQPGNSLWRLSRRTYGQGVLYTLIYGVNQDQIKDPDLIYPGQILALPLAH